MSAWRLDQLGDHRNGRAHQLRPDEGRGERHVRRVRVEHEGNDENSGSEGKPLKTMGAGVAKAGTGRVYVCGENFTDSVEVKSSVTLYGALDCANAGRTTR